MGQSPSWEQMSRSAMQTLKALCRVHKRRRSVPILSQINPAHALPPYLFIIRFNIILPTKQIASSLQVFQLKLCTHFSSLMGHMPRPLIRLGLKILIIHGEVLIRISSLWDFLQLLVTSFFPFGPYLSSILFSNASYLSYSSTMTMEA